MSSDSDNNSTTPEVVQEEETLNNSPEKGQAGDYHDKIKVPPTDNHDDQKVDGDHVVRDIIMWRRKKISGVLMVVSTVLWVLLEVYRFNFLSLASWTAIAFIALLFVYASILALLRKEVGEMKGLEISEEKAKEMAQSAKRVMEKGIRLMFHVSCEREWYFFAGVVSALLLLAYLGRHFTLLNFLYAGTMVGMTVPVMYVKREKQIRAYGERMRGQGTRLYAKVDDKVLSKFKPKKEEIKEKKVQ